jgi:hypothetical protein
MAMNIKASAAVLGVGTFITLGAMAVGVPSHDGGAPPQQLAGPMQTGVTATTTTPPSAPETSFAAPTVKAPHT